MSIRLTLALAAWCSVLAGCGDGSAPSAPSPALGGIEVTFKVDPRIARGLYMGDRWISPPICSATAWMTRSTSCGTTASVSPCPPTFSASASS